MKSLDFSKPVTPRLTPVGNYREKITEGITGWKLPGKITEGKSPGEFTCFGLRTRENH